MAIFGFGVAIVGMLMLALVAAQIAQSVAAQDWRQVEAEVLEAKLVESTDSDGTDYTILECSYRYQFDGAQHIGTRATLDWMAQSGNKGQVHDAFKAMSDAKSSRRPIQVWVNPDDPSESAYSRDLQLDQLLTLLGMGLPLSVLGAFSIRGARTRTVMVALDNESTMATAEMALEWVGKGIPPDLDQHSEAIWFGGMVATAIAVPLDIAALQGSQGQDSDRDLVLFLAAGVSMLAAAMIMMACSRMLRRRSLRNLTVSMDPNPGCIGGDVGGWFQLPAIQDRSEPLRVRLSCRRRLRRDAYELLWHDSQIATLSASGRQASFLFASKPGLPESKVDREIEWVLETTLMTERGEQSLQWLVPVFTGQRSSTLARNRHTEPPTTRLLPGDPDTPWGTGIERKSAEGLELIFPSTGSVLYTVGGTLFSAAIGAAFWFFPDFVRTQDQDPDQFLTICFRGIAVVFVPLVILVTPLVKHRAEKLTVDSRSLELQWSVLGITFRTLSIPRADIVGLAPYQDCSVVVCTEDDHHVIISGLDGASPTMRAARELAQRTRLPLLEKPPE
jgi:Protein of unknown function (DUF3592)